MANLRGFLGAVRAKDVRRDHFLGWMLLTVAGMYVFSFGYLGQLENTRIYVFTYMVVFFAGCWIYRSKYVP